MGFVSCACDFQKKPVRKWGKQKKVEEECRQKRGFKSLISGPTRRSGAPQNPSLPWVKGWGFDTHPAAPGGEGAVISQGSPGEAGHIDKGKPLEKGAGGNH